MFVARNLSEAHIVSGMLNAAGIGANVRGHYLAGGYGELPITSDTLPSVWIDDATQAEVARSVIDEYERRADARSPRGVASSAAKSTAGSSLRAGNAGATVRWSRVGNMAFRSNCSRVRDGSERNADRAFPRLRA